MSRMLPGIETLEQHRELLESNPDAYKPERCPHCGKAGLHHHGHYERNAPRGRKSNGLRASIPPLRAPDQAPAERSSGRDGVLRGQSG
jgi:hypothetical protein